MPYGLKDEKGKIYGRLEVLSYHGGGFWNCRCSCKKQTLLVVYGTNLRNGTISSCGCINKELNAQRFTIHGNYASNPRLYGIWYNMIERCENSSYENYPIYGGKGISVDDDVKDYEKFYKWAYENGYKDDLTLDRIDSNKNYSFDNMRWATWEVQNRNKKDLNFIEYNGKIKCLSEWAEIFRIDRSTLSKRIHNMGLSFEEAINYHKK